MEGFIFHFPYYISHWSLQRNGGHGPEMISADDFCNDN